jgi:hypothetical protein
LRFFVDGFRSTLIGPTSTATSLTLKPKMQTAVHQTGHAVISVFSKTMRVRDHRRDMATLVRATSASNRPGPGRLCRTGSDLHRIFVLFVFELMDYRVSSSAKVSAKADRTKGK